MDAFGKLSQDRAAAAHKAGGFDTQLVPVDAAVLDEHRTPTGRTQKVVRDEGLRETSLEKLATFKPTGRENEYTPPRRRRRSPTVRRQYC